MEHHANIIPWQMIAEERGARLRVIPMNERGELIIEEYENMLNERTRIVAVAHVSNSLGTINPIQGDDRDRPQIRRSRFCRCRPERPAFPGRCAGPRLRFPDLLRPQDVCTHRQRRALR